MAVYGPAFPDRRLREGVPNLRRVTILRPHLLHQSVEEVFLLRNDQVRRVESTADHGDSGGHFVESMLTPEVRCGEAAPRSAGRSEVP